MGHMWTLAIEEQFYILWPLAVIAVLGLAAARHGGRALAGLLLAGIVVSVASRFLLWESSEIWSRVYFRTDARMDLIRSEEPTSEHQSIMRNSVALFFYK